MPKIQLELTDAQDKIVAIYKINHQLETKGEAIAQIIEAYDKVKK